VIRIVEIDHAPPIAGARLSISLQMTQRSMHKAPLEGGRAQCDVVKSKLITEPMRPRTVVAERLSVRAETPVAVPIDAEAAAVRTVGRRPNVARREVGIP
jgi:hypothetical protein